MTLKSIIKYTVIVLLGFLLGAATCFYVYHKSLDGRALAMYAVAVKYFENNEFKKAQDLTWQAIGLKDDEPWFYELLAEASEKRKDYDDAKEFYKITIDLYAKKGNKGKMQYTKEKLKRLDGIQKEGREVKGAGK